MKTSFADKQATPVKAFSLIEIVLALGLIAFGLASLAALFPAGLKANRDAIGETYAAEHADQLLHFLKNHIANKSDDYANWEAYASKLPTSKPGSSEPDSGWEKWFTEKALRYDIAGDQNQFYHVTQPSLTGEGNEFDAICRLWRTPVSISTLDTDGKWVTTQLSSDDALALNMEISWPTQTPYASRKKAVFQLEVQKLTD